MVDKEILTNLINFLHIEYSLQIQYMTPILFLTNSSIRIPIEMFPPGHSQRLGSADGYVDCIFKEKVSVSSNCINFILKKRFRFTSVGDIDMGGIMTLEKVNNLSPLLYKILLPTAFVRPFIFCYINDSLHILRETYIGGVNQMFNINGMLDNKTLLSTILYSDLVLNTRKLQVMTYNDDVYITVDIGNNKGKFDPCIDPYTEKGYIEFFELWKVRIVEIIHNCLEMLDKEQIDQSRMELLAYVLKSIQGKIC
jgi:hypothetical protein